MEEKFCFRSNFRWLNKIFAKERTKFENPRKKPEYFQQLYALCVKLVQTIDK